MREIRLSGLEGGVADIRHPYPYFIETRTKPIFFPELRRSGIKQLLAIFLLA